ncbi:MAG: hypothetical protein JXA37_09220 [Chloroflexia bacterium]|nr:hypothetical protein [Chloroflexia bacterium]
MRNVRRMSLISILALLGTLLLAPLAWAEGPVYGAITYRGTVDCFAAGLQNDEGKPIYCETSAVVFNGSAVILASDKDIPNASAIFAFPYGGDGAIGGPLTYLGHHTMRTAIKYEDMALTPDKQYVIASTGFDRIMDDSNEWDGYNALMLWPNGNPDAVQLVAETDNGGVLSSAGLRDDISRALATPAFPDGVPYFKTEGMTVIPGNRFLFGVRELGARYDDFDYAVKIISAQYEIVDGEMALGDFCLVYDFDASSESRIEQTVALSSIEYDPYHDRLYMLTSFETEESDEGLGGYLWTLPIDDLNNNRPPTLVLKKDGEPLLFAHKAEGVTVLGDNRVMVVHDDDRVLGRDEVSDTETQFSRGAHQAAYTVVALSTSADTLPDTGGTTLLAYGWVLVLAGGAVLVGVGLRRVTVER